MRKKVRVIAALLVVALLATACFSGATNTGSGPRNMQQTSTSVKSGKPNVVFILTDDLSWNMVKYMSAVQDMRRNGTTFTNFFAADGLCCPSRANIFTGRYPHNTGVRVNEEYRGGGNAAFERNGNHKRTYAVELDDAGYRTGHLGKYINGHEPATEPVPPGWDEWHVSHAAYGNIPGSYSLTDIRHKGDSRKVTRPNVYLNDLLGQRARAVADRARGKGDPFFLQLSSFAPHHRVGSGRPEPKFPAALRDRPSLGWPGGEYPYGDCGRKPDDERYDCHDLKVPRGDGYSDATYRKLDWHYRDRVQMMQSLDDQMIKLRRRLAANGQLDNTYFVFSSDNGFHLGEHGLRRGKGTAYDHDTRVPLIVEGPGIERGAVRRELTQTVDLYPTFQQMAGLRPKPSDGRGLLPLMRGKKRKTWRDGVLFEHKPQEEFGNPYADPDLDNASKLAVRNRYVPSFHPFNAVRTKKWLYVEYLDSRRRELYDLHKDRAQDHNVARKHRRVVTKLSGWLDAYTKCGKRDTASCSRTSHEPRHQPRHQPRN